MHDSEHGRAERSDQHHPREADAVVGGEVGEDEAGDPGERELDDRDLADEAGDHDDREAHDRRQERRDQRLAEVVGKDDQRDDRGRRAEQSGLPEPLRARREGEPLLDELAAARQARSRARTSRPPSAGRRAAAGRPATRRRCRSGTSPGPGSSRGSVSSEPIARPTRQAIQNEVKRAKSAAVSAGTTCSGRACGSSWMIEAASTPRPPAKNVASSVLDSARRLGERPISIARDLVLRGRPRREPEARVAGKTSESTSVAARTMPGRMNRSIGTFEPKTVTVPPGSTGGCGFVPIPNASETNGLRDEQQPERGGELGQRRRRPQRPEDPNSTSNATRAGRPLSRSAPERWTGTGCRLRRIPGRPTRARSPSSATSSSSPRASRSRRSPG